MPSQKSVRLRPDELIFFLCPPQSFSSPPQCLQTCIGVRRRLPQKGDCSTRNIVGSNSTPTVSLCRILSFDDGQSSQKYRIKSSQARNNSDEDACRSACHLLHRRESVTSGKTDGRGCPKNFPWTATNCQSAPICGQIQTESGTFSANHAQKTTQISVRAIPYVVRTSKKRTVILTHRAYFDKKCSIFNYAHYEL